MSITARPLASAQAWLPGEGSPAGPGVHLCPSAPRGWASVIPHPWVCLTCTCPTPVPGKSSAAPWGPPLACTCPMPVPGSPPLPRGALPHDLCCSLELCSAWEASSLLCRTSRFSAGSRGLTSHYKQSGAACGAWLQVPRDWCSGQAGGPINPGLGQAGQAGFAVSSGERCPLCV